jgi:hypothetical protein
MQSEKEREKKDHQGFRFFFLSKLLQVRRRRKTKEQ